MTRLARIKLIINSFISSSLTLQFLMNSDSSPLVQQNTQNLHMYLRIQQTTQKNLTH